nr:immunoglobulin heavy chain junction region [Mus musculus]
CARRDYETFYYTMDYW